MPQAHQMRLKRTSNTLQHIVATPAYIQAQVHNTGACKIAVARCDL